MTTEERIERALHSANPGRALRTLVLDLHREGHSKADIYETFERFVLRLRTNEDAPEFDEDAVLDVMDALTGWCHSDAELLPEKPA